ncbi:hypothetical protein EYC80_001702 [Monilinia laxa]|uniref:Uncharacterized protein n=1 Tax=Monilinia laxa TaxID=61186 RepID=A0A5N6K5R7_MONLA|nr:hypothetical protein EYC80_001702 [Monilinia laxa]
MAEVICYKKSYSCSLYGLIKYHQMRGEQPLFLLLNNTVLDIHSIQCSKKQKEKSLYALESPDCFFQLLESLSTSHHTT